MGAIYSVPLYDSLSATDKGEPVTKLTSMGHLILGVVGIGCATTLAALHDISGTTAVDLIVAIVGVSLGIGAATNSTPLPPA